MFLMDTDHLTLVENGGTEGEIILARIRAVPPDDFGISIVSYAEKTKGWLARIHSVAAPDVEVRAFAKLQRSLRLCMSYAIWEYNDDAAAICAQLRAQKIRIGTQDMRIASIALANNATPLTRNRRDFEKVPGLLFADWTIE